jgi:hypothetical protein
MGNRLIVLAALVLLPLALAGCSKPAAPTGKWEGGAQQGGTIVVARVETLPGGKVRIMAPNITDVTGPAARFAQMRARLAAELATNWDTVAPRPFDFDGKTFRKPGGIAPQMVWDKTTNQMTIMLYIGTRPAFPVTLRPVTIFHDNPWPQG